MKLFLIVKVDQEISPISPVICRSQRGPGTWPGQDCSPDWPGNGCPAWTRKIFQVGGETSECSYQVLLISSCSFSYLVSIWRISLSSKSNLCQGIQSAATERTRERTNMVKPAQFIQGELWDLSLLLLLSSAGGLIIDSSWSMVLSAGMQQSGKGRENDYFWRLTRPCQCQGGTNKLW